ncbi:MAG: hypothetical protein ACRDKY_13875 [Solirubrobacteraceae bacterium]
MRKLIKLAIVAFGIRAFLRWRKGRHETAYSTSPPPEPASDPADELRRKLAETREDDTPLEADATPEVPVADRRADVHDQGRATLDEMTASSED